jgi:hypothetical protein
MTFLRPGTFMRNFVNYLGRIIKTQNVSEDDKSGLSDTTVTREDKKINN